MRTKGRVCVQLKALSMVETTHHRIDLQKRRQERTERRTRVGLRVVHYSEQTHTAGRLPSRAFLPIPVDSSVTCTWTRPRFPDPRKGSDGRRFRLQGMIGVPSGLGANQNSDDRDKGGGRCELEAAHAIRLDSLLLLHDRL